MEGEVKMSRKEKRKAAKKQKRKEVRREVALKELAEEEARLNDPEEQMRIKMEEQMEAERSERERKEFEERERRWIEEAEARKRAEEEERKKFLEDDQRKQVENEDESKEGDEWEYVEEGPAEIIWQGNEIIVKKKKVRVAKKDVDRQFNREDTDRPTSNPLPPQSEAFDDFKHASLVSTPDVFDNVAQQIPNFGTEQDKAHCPFHIKTGACRFGQRCSRVHFYPDKSCTLLLKNMYNGPGLAWEQDEGLEYTDEEVEHCYEEFYEDVHTEFLKFGEIVNFKVCRNGSFHLRGNVYVHYKSLDSAVLAYRSINGRYFAGKQVTCEFVGVTRWKVAICGEYMKSRLKTCSHGTACNFIHCFRNPGGDYEWADWDKPPPRYWVKKMVALFGCSDELGYEKQMEQEYLGRLSYSSNTVRAYAKGYHSRRSRSRDIGYLDGDSWRKQYDGNDNREERHWRRHKIEGRKQTEIKDDRVLEETTFKDHRHSKWQTRDTDLGDFSDGQRDKSHRCTRKSSLQEFSDDSHEFDSDGEWSEGKRQRDRHHKSTRKRSRFRNKVREIDHGDYDSDGDLSDKYSDSDRYSSHRRRKRSRYCYKEKGLADEESRENSEEKNDKVEKGYNRKHQKPQRKFSDDENYDSDGMGRYDGRSKSPEQYSGYRDENHRQSSGRSEKDHKSSRRKSSKHHVRHHRPTDEKSESSDSSIMADT